MFERLEKMDRRSLVAIAIAVVVGILIFSGIASGIRQAGWNEGFLVGLLSGGTEGGQAMNPYLAMRGYGIHGWGWHPFWIVGGIFKFFFFGFLMMMLFKFFAFRRWGHRYGYPGGPEGHWGRHPWDYSNAQQQQTGHGPQTQSQSGNPTAADPMPGAVKQAQNPGGTQV